MRTEYEKYNDQLRVWQVLDDPDHGIYTGAFATRKAARAHRMAIAGQTATPEQPSNSEPAATPEAQNNACLSETASVESPSDKEVTVAQEATSMVITLTKRNVEKSGNVAYAQAGVRASVYFNKNMFATGAALPETITIEAPDGTFAAPGEVKVAATSPEKAAKAKEAAEKAAARAAKALANAEKLAARAAKLAPADAAPASE